MGEIGGCAKIIDEDIADGINYWNYAIVCYVLGANPPIHVIEGFLKRIWKNKNIDRVSLLTHGVFLVHFHSIEDRDGILKGGYQFFDKKPLIMKAWDPDVKFTREQMWKVPVWVQLRQLDLNYWGERSMGKIVSTLGRMIKQDQATMNRDKLEFAQVLIEMDISKGFPNSIKFEDEKGSLVYLEVSYEWKPEKCATCNGIGHTSNVCKKAKVVEQMKKIWKPKEVTETVENPPEKETEEDHGFKKVKGKKVVIARPSQVNTSNAFEVLEDISMQEEQVGKVLCEMQSIIDGGGDPPPING
ncbi:uncharacterized protein LOC133833090 [Humulus lupulus]|uniref:uncharacterized protein LOC133833090 n=1 Tax=Humulus lupulus TaxID=3486 RepID=UPI002B40F861|nr:uncharacterized protein LOC133833090 [Humulus lupulus]